MKKTLVFLILLVAQNLLAQDYKFGKVSKEELSQKEYFPRTRRPKQRFFIEKY